MTNKRALSRHNLELPFPVIDDCLYVGGRPLTRLVEQVGGTPFFVYDRAVINQRLGMLRELFPKEVRVHYAIKANPMPALVHHIADLVDGLDVASAREMQIALNTGTPPGKISIAGPGKTKSELSRAVAAGIIINVESYNELKNLCELGDRMGVRPTVALRVNPDFELKTSGMKMGGGPKQFGIDAEIVPKLLKGMTSLDIKFVGFHIFSGSQNLRPDAIVEAQNKTVDLALTLARGWPEPLQTLNIGGGLGIPYFPGECPLDISPIGENLTNIMERIKYQQPEVELVLEFGRYLVGEAGSYVCQVIDKKMSRGQVFLITDGGLHHHLAASGNFGQVIRKNYPVVVGNKVTGSTREVVSIVGPLCTPLDVIADKMEVAKADLGDYIAVLQSGAYGRTASPIEFLSHPPPEEIIV
jgi:diaminopimelate decarboxylase